MSTATAADWKVKEVKTLIDFISKPSIVGIINLENLPAKQLQKMRESLRSDVKMRVSKKTFFELAINESKKESLKELLPYFKGPCVIVTTEMNPFKLYATIDRNKSSAPAKAGATAPEDVEVKAGITSMIPGPDLSILKQAGLDTKIQEGKIAVGKDKVVVKAGEVINEKVAAALTKLGIEPLKVGMNLVAVCEGDSIFTSSVLSIDEDVYAGNFATAYSNALNLSVFAGIHNKESLPLMVSKAARETRALAIEANILTKETVKPIIQKASRQSIVVASMIPESTETKTISKEETEKADSKKETATTEETSEKAKEEPKKE